MMGNPTTRWLLALSALSLASCGGGSNGPPDSMPYAPGWTALYSFGIQACDDFEFGELHYCVKRMNAQVGQTVRMTFTLTGTGTLYPVEAADLPPATLRLFVATDPSGYSSTRWWCPTSKTDMPGPGTYSVSCVISSEWTGVGGGMPTPPIGGINYVGFTTGGQYFAGHGVRVNGQVHFTLNSFDVGAMSARRKARRR